MYYSRTLIENATNKALKLIVNFEGIILNPYLCPSGVATIGVGSTFYENGVKVKMTDASISRDRAMILLKNNIVHYVESVVSMLQVDVSENQMASLIDFAYNCGAQNLRTSTLLRLVNQRDFMKASEQFTKWIYGAGEILPGLVKRRLSEKALFLTT